MPKECRKCLRLLMQHKNWYNANCNSVLVPGLETAKFTIGSTVQLCAAIKTAAHFFVVLLNRLLAVPQSGWDLRGAPLFFPRRATQPIIISAEIRNREIMYEHQMPILWNQI